MLPEDIDGLQMQESDLRLVHFGLRDHLCSVPMETATLPEGGSFNRNVIKLSSIMTISNSEFSLTQVL